MNKRKIQRARRIIQRAGGQIFSAEFVKRNGELRLMVARRGVKKDLTGQGLAFDPEERGLITVYDMQKQGYRMINLGTLRRLRVGGKEYTWD